MEWCSNENRCGGCFYQGISYEEELKRKEGEIRDLFSPLVIGDFHFEGIIPSPKKEAYRNKMEFSFGDQEKDGPLCLGLHQKRSFFNILNTEDCRLPSRDMGEILLATRVYFQEKGISYFHKKRHEGYLRHLLIRRAEKTGEILLSLIHNGFEDKKLSEQDGLQNIAIDEVGAQNGGNSVIRTTVCTDNTMISSSLAKLSEDSLLRGWCERLLSLEKEGKLEGHFAGILHTRNESVADAVVNQGTEILYGKDYFYEELLGLNFKITPFSFFQTNTLGAEKLYEKIREYADLSDTAVKKPIIFDLYSGTGTITQLMSKVAKKAYGVEIVEEAVESAKENAIENGITNCHFIAGDVLKVLEESKARNTNHEESGTTEERNCINAVKGTEGIKELEENVEQILPIPDFIIVDPPRDGMHKKALDLIIRYGVNRLIYVACKPKSLARDLEALQNAGYRVQKLCAVDLFPRTNNCEVVCLLKKDFALA